MLLQRAVTDQDGDTVVASLDLSGGVLAIEDDGPSAGVLIQVAPGAIALDESPLPPGGDGVRSTSLDLSGNFVGLAFGSDGPGTAGYVFKSGLDGAASNMHALDATAGSFAQGDAILLWLSADRMTITGSTATSASAISAGNTYFTITVDASGTLTFTQTQNVWHPDGQDDDDAVAIVTVADTLVLEAVRDQDGDGGDAGLDLSGGVFVIADDGPAVTSVTASGTVALDETAGRPATIPSRSLETPLTATSAAAIAIATFTHGTDGADTVTLAGGGEFDLTGLAIGNIENLTRSLEARAARLAREGGAGGAAADCAAGRDGASPAECAQETVLQAVRQQALQSRLNALEAAIEQRRRELAEAQATGRSLRESIALAQRQVDMLTPLAGRAIVPQTELLAARRELVDLQGRLAAVQQGISRASAAVGEARAQAAEARFQFQQEALDERSQLAARIAVNAESRRGAEGRVQRTELRAPVEGIVNDVQVTTVGGFVNAGQQIMQVVPVGDRLLVEARVKPGDIAFIRVGQRALVKVTAYDFSIYGGLAGIVVQVSADSIYDEAAKEAHFTVIVETDSAFLTLAGRELPIGPGMLCDVEILTGRKSVLTYLLKPVLKAKSEALAER